MDLQGPVVIDLAALVARFEARVAACAGEAPGSYRRWACPGPGRDLEPNPYGCADAANLLYTLGLFPLDERERAVAVAALQSFQDPASGFFRESSHHEIHVTAHCIAALELFDARPAHALKGLARLEEPGALEAFLEGLPWRDDPWLASHRGAGIYAARLLAGEASSSWQERYFAWLDAACDPASGLWRRGRLEPPYAWGASRFPYLAGSFHYLFNYEHARRPHPHPAALVDTCLSIFEAGDEWPLGRTVSFAEVDWVYCLARALRLSDQRRHDAERALRAFAADYVDFLTQLDWDADDGGSDLHRIFGAACALAELQRAVPGLLRTPRPLRLVLDRRPFI
jgi:hypothetical protein